MSIRVCERCRRELSLSGYLVHQRHCSKRLRSGGELADRDSEIRAGGRPNTGRGHKLRRLELFSGGRDANVPRIGPGAPGRREDFGIHLEAAGDDVENPLQEALDHGTAHEGGADMSGNASIEEPMGGLEWTRRATEVEVSEAFSHVLLRIGKDMGAKWSDHVLGLLRHPSWNLDCVLRNAETYGTLVKKADDVIQEHLERLSFERVSLRGDDVVGVNATMWSRGVRDVLMRQVRQMNVRNQPSSRLLTTCFRQLNMHGERAYGHPMTTGLAFDAEKRVRAEILRLGATNGVSPEGTWTDGYDFVAFVQVYSDKSAQTLKTSSQTHFPMHAVIMNTSLEMKEKMVCAGDAIVAYLPVNYKWAPVRAHEWDMELEDGTGASGDRESRLRVLHLAIERTLTQISDATLYGFEVVDSIGVPRRCHPVIWSYVADMPEGWDVSGTVHGRCSDAW